MVRVKPEAGTAGMLYKIRVGRRIQLNENKKIQILTKSPWPCSSLLRCDVGFSIKTAAGFRNMSFLLSLIYLCFMSRS